MICNTEISNGIVAPFLTGARISEPSTGCFRNKNMLERLHIKHIKHIQTCLKTTNYIQLPTYRSKRSSCVCITAKRLEQKTNCIPLHWRNVWVRLKSETSTLTTSWLWGFPIENGTPGYMQLLLQASAHLGPTSGMFDFAVLLACCRWGW